MRQALRSHVSSPDAWKREKTKEKNEQNKNKDRNKNKIKNKKQLRALIIHKKTNLAILVFFYLFSIFFRSSYFSGDVFLLCSRTRYASTLFAYLDSLATFGFSLSL